MWVDEGIHLSSVSSALTLCRSVISSPLTQESSLLSIKPLMPHPSGSWPGVWEHEGLAWCLGIAQQKVQRGVRWTKWPSGSHDFCLPCPNKTIV